MSRISPYTTFQQYKTKFPSCSPINQDLLKLLIEQQRKFMANLNPFNMCPTLTFWFPITQNTRMGVSVQTLERVKIGIRQRLVPNDVMHLTVRFIQIRIPFPLILLILFSSLGSWINGAVNKLIDNLTTQLKNEQEELLNNLEEEIEFLFPDFIPDSSQLTTDVMDKVRETLVEENEKSTQQNLNPFNLVPIMTCYFPIYKTHTGVGIGFMDFQRLSISVRQFMEPLDQIFTSIRFIELKVPFPLAIFVWSLCVGLSLNGSVNTFGNHDEIMNEIKQIFRQYRK